MIKKANRKNANYIYRKEIIKKGFELHHTVTRFLCFNFWFILPSCFS